jgi:hypothetical protein
MIRLFDDNATLKALQDLFHTKIPNELNPGEGDRLILLNQSCFWQCGMFVKVERSMSWWAKSDGSGNGNLECKPKLYEQ